MPVSFPRGVRKPVTLNLHGDVPEAERPLFHVEFLTCRAQIEVERAIARAVATPVAEAAAEQAALLDAIKGFLRGWERFNDKDGNPIPFSVESLPDLLEREELWDLIRAWRQAATVRVEDRKKSSSPSGSATASSAPPAAALPAETTAAAPASPR